MKFTRSEQSLLPADAQESGAAATVGTNDRAAFGQAEAKFFDLIYDLDPDAANDDYYATSAEFLGLQSEIRAKLILGLLVWFASVCATLVAAVVVYG